MKKLFSRYSRGHRNKPLERSIKYLLRRTRHTVELHGAGDSDLNVLRLHREMLRF